MGPVFQNFQEFWVFTWVNEPIFEKKILRISNTLGPSFFINIPKHGSSFSKFPRVLGVHMGK